MEDEEYREQLESKRFEIIQNLQVDRPFVFDYLRHKGVLDSEDCELIRCEKTTPLKIGKFVDVLARKGPQAYQYLLESLQLEHPALYEKLTGEQADATTSPIMMKLKRSFTGVGGPLVNSELEILTRHLERTYGDLHEMSRRFEQVVQHKKDIEEQLQTTTNDLERHKETVDLLKKKIDLQMTNNTTNTNCSHWPQCVQYIDNMRKEISNRDIYIIALQTNVMSSREEIEVLKKKNESLTMKNDEFQKMIAEMNESFHLKKCESLRLSERIERQGNEIKKAEQTMRKYRECLFHKMRLREEKEHLQEELDELIKWTEALKTRYDIVEHEKKRTVTDHTMIMADYGSLQEELMKCREEMNEVQLVAADLRERARHLEHDRQTYKRQRDEAFTARREAILDRDKAFLERDQAVKKYNELQSAKDATVDNKIIQLKSYDEVVARCDVIEDELKHVKITLRQTERKLEELKVKYGVDGGQSEDDEEKLDENENEVGPKDSEESVPEINVDNTSGNASEESGSSAREPPSPTTMVESIKRRMAPPTPTFAGNKVLTFPLFHSTEPFFASEGSLLATLPITVSTSRVYNTLPKEGGSPKEGGLDRKGVSRVPIKMRQNSNEDALSQASQNGEAVSSGGDKGTNNISPNTVEGQSTVPVNENDVTQTNSTDGQEAAEKSAKSSGSKDVKS